VAVAVTLAAVAVAGQAVATETTDPTQPNLPLIGQTTLPPMLLLPQPRQPPTVTLARIVTRNPTGRIIRRHTAPQAQLPPPTDLMFNDQ
jgi:hypothetical protein